MTEMTASFDRFPWRDMGTQPRYVIDPVAFFVALFGAPLWVALLGFWTFGIPVFAVAFGGPIYLVVGLPVLLIHLRRNPGNTDDIIELAFFTVLVLALAEGGLFALLQGRDALELVAFFGGFGLIFGPMWAWAFGWIYNTLRNDLSRVAH